MAKKRQNYAHILTDENNGSRERYLEAAVDHRTKPQPESKRQTYAHILTSENRGDRPLQAVTNYGTKSQPEPARQTHAHILTSRNRGDRPLQAVTNFKAKPRTTQSSTQSYRGGGHEPRDSNVPARYRNAGSGGHEPQRSGISSRGYRQAGRGGWEPQGSNALRKSGGGAYDKPGLAKAYYDTRRQVMGSKTPNHRPDEQYSPVTTGKERTNHKYIAKVRTKDGKIRYIYDLEGGNIHNTNKKSNDQFNKSQNKAAVNNKGATRNPFDQASKAIGTAINSGRSWLKSAFGI